MNDFYSPEIPNFPLPDDSAPQNGDSDQKFRILRAWGRLVRQLRKGVHDERGHFHQLPPIVAGGIQVPVYACSDPQGLLPVLLVEADRLYSVVAHQTIDLHLIADDEAPLKATVDRDPGVPASALLPLLTQVMVGAQSSTSDGAAVVLDQIINQFLLLKDWYLLPAFAKAKAMESSPGDLKAAMSRRDREEPPPSAHDVEMYGPSARLYRRLTYEWELKNWPPRMYQLRSALG